MQFGKNLAKALADKGLTQAALAEEAGVSQGAISRYLNGKASPKAEELQRIAAALSVRMEWLLTGQGPASAMDVEGQLESVISWLKTMAPEHLATPGIEAEAREYWRDILEAKADAEAARCGKSGPPDILALADMLESAFSDFGDKLQKFGEAFGDVEITSGSEVQENVQRRWDELIGTLRRLNRRKSSLVGEVRAKFEPEAW